MNLKIPKLLTNLKTKKNCLDLTIYKYIIKILKFNIKKNFRKTIVIPQNNKFHKIIQTMKIPN